MDWKKLENDITLFANGYLIIDGYHISISLDKYKLKLSYTIYVNGMIKGEWLTKDHEIALKFYFRKTISFLSKKSWIEIYGKRKGTKKFIEEKSWFPIYSFNSFRSLKSVLSKNESIERTDLSHEAWEEAKK